jgi:hypothetical protein
MQLIHRLNGGLLGEFLGMDAGGCRAAVQLTELTYRTLQLVEAEFEASLPTESWWVL